MRRTRRAVRHKSSRDFQIALLLDCATRSQSTGLTLKWDAPPVWMGDCAMAVEARMIGVVRAIVTGKREHSNGS
ncbi:MAG: hypothetical protein J7M17_07770 [Anaerolineae bacterium]|nr:hypothetical protein [Anaerolineae bacterium]